MNRLNKEVKSQYLPAKIREKQMQDNPEKFEKMEKGTHKQNFQSTLEFNGGVDEYLSIAKLANKKFDTLQEQVVVQNIHADNQELKMNEYNKLLIENTTKNSGVQSLQTMAVQIPKRPKYLQGMKPKEFENLENEAYLNWRRALSELEMKNENMVVTPYEKNISIWRQLWLTIEKCQVLIQIVDARNPLFFRSEDLETYIKSVSNSKDYVLLINKADLLSEEMRISWADYFKQKGIKFYFFSALIEDSKLEEEKENESEEELEETEEYSISNKKKDKELRQKQREEDLAQLKSNNKSKKNKNKKKEIVEDKENEEKAEDSNKKDPEEKDVNENEKTGLINKELNLNQNNKGMNNPILKNYSGIEEQDFRIHNREELIVLIKLLSKGKEKNHNSKAYQIGFIGYPNVGKSSVINVLMKKKKVGVALMPGKTKHYQTLFLPNEEEICLMDCPGLVFPSFTFSKADLVINGIMPIDKIVDYLIPIQLIIYNVPKHILENSYKIQLPDIYSSSQFLQILAMKHGYLTGRSIPNEAKASRMVLKDYISGNLLYCYVRPDYDPVKHGDVSGYLFSLGESINEEDLEKLKENQEILKQIPANFDDNYEKIGIEVGEKKVINDNDIDHGFFDNDDSRMDMLNQGKVPKEVRMVLKFAMKRGEISVEDYENIFTLEEAKDALENIEKMKELKGENKKGKSLVEKKGIDNYAVKKI